MKASTGVWSSRIHAQASNLTYSVLLQNATMSLVSNGEMSEKGRQVISLTRNQIKYNRECPQKLGVGYKPVISALGRFRSSKPWLPSVTSRTAT